MKMGATKARLLLGFAAGLAVFGSAAVSFAQEDQVLARVNNVEIRASDAQLAERLFDSSNSAAPPDAKQSALVDALIDLKVISDAAIAAGIENDPAYQRQLSLLKQQVLRASFLERKAAEAVSDEVVRKTYDDQVAKIPPVNEVRVRHILVNTEADATQAIAAITAGEDFGAVAARASKDELSKQNGGDLGFGPLEQLPSELGAAVVQMQPGDLSPKPVQSSFGYHVVKLEEKRTRRPPPFEAVSGQIRSSLEASAAQKIASELRSKASVEKLVPDVPMPSGDGHAHDPGDESDEAVK